MSKESFGQMSIPELVNGKYYYKIDYNFDGNLENKMTVNKGPFDSFEELLASKKEQIELFLNS